MSCRHCWDTRNLIDMRCDNCGAPYSVCKDCLVNIDAMFPHQCGFKSSSNTSSKNKRKLDEYEDNWLWSSSYAPPPFNFLSSNSNTPSSTRDDFGGIEINSTSRYVEDESFLCFKDDFYQNTNKKHYGDYDEKKDEEIEFFDDRIEDGKMEEDTSWSIDINQSDNFGIFDFVTSNNNSPNLPPTEISACTFGNGGGHELTSNTERPVNLEIGVATWNINHLGKTTDYEYWDDREGREAAEKQRIRNEKITNKLATIERIFAQHAWLDVLILQEVNESSVIELNDPTLEYIKGPRMKALAIGKKPKTQNSKSFKVTYEKKEEWAKPGQGEYYGIVIRKNTLAPENWAITHEGCDIFYRNQLEEDARMDASTPYYWSKLCGTAAKADTDDELVEDSSSDEEDDDEDENEPVTNEQLKKDEQVKKEVSLLKLENLPTFRPIIVHKLKINDKEIKIAVVHTSPKGKTFFRKSVYAQVKELFTLVSKKSESGEFWIVGGDYYLEPEATVDIDSNSYSFTEPRMQLKKESNKQYGVYKKEHAKKMSDKRTKKEDLLGGKIHWGRTNKRFKGAEKLLLKEQFKDKFKIEDSLKPPGYNKTPEFNLKIAISLSATNQGRVTNDAARKIVRNPRMFYGFYTKLTSNPKTRDYVSNSRADFFVCSLNFVFTYAGLINPLGKNILVVDTQHNALNWWSKISDHAPIGAIFSVNNQAKKWELVKKDLYNDAHQQQVNKQVAKIKNMAYDDIRHSLALLRKKIDELPVANSTQKKNTQTLKAAYYRLLHTLNAADSEFLNLIFAELNVPNEWFEILENSDKNDLDAFEKRCLEYKNSPHTDAFEYAFYLVRQIANNLRTLAFDFNAEMFEIVGEEEKYLTVNAASTK